MAEATVIKNTRRQAVVSAAGTGTFHANLQPLLYSNISGEVDQVFSEANAVASITGVVYSVTGTTTVARGGTTYLNLTSGQESWKFAQEHGFVINSNTDLDSNSNITINFGASTGTVILTISKEQGFNDLDLQNDFRRV